MSLAHDQEGHASSSSFLVVEGRPFIKIWIPPPPPPKNDPRHKWSPSPDIQNNQTPSPNISKYLNPHQTNISEIEQNTWTLNKIAQPLLLLFAF